MATKKKAEVTEEKRWDEDLVEIEPLFYDKERYSEPVFVGINGRNWYIPRGVKGIKVPKVVKEVLDQSAYQTQYAGKYMASIEGTRNLGDF